MLRRVVKDATGKAERIGTALPGETIMSEVSMDGKETQQPPGPPRRHTLIQPNRFGSVPRKHF